MRALAALFLFLCNSNLLAQESFQSALAFHAAFDKSLEADFSRGDTTCWIRKGKEVVPLQPNEEVKLVSGGRFEGCLHFPAKGATRPQYSGSGILGYNAKNWNATVSVWLKLSPDEDLEPGYCDPVQIVGNDSKKGFIFLEWSKDETPRFFRFAIRPLFEIWNPNNLQWTDIPFDKRPMVQVARAPFGRDHWTHVAFTIENVNSKEAAAKSGGSLFINGTIQGRIEGWDLTFGWDPASVALVLGASYVGHMDDLAIFDRVLTAEEVNRLYLLQTGVSGLR